MSRYLQVAFNLPLQQTFTYLDLDDAATASGVRVVAPFGKRRVTGFVIGTPRQPPAGVELRAIARRVDAQPVFDGALLALARWIADTYLCSVGEALAAMIPSGRREILPDAAAGTVERWRDHALTEEQERAVAALTAPGAEDAGGAAQPPRFYLRGVTGSGKTAVFMAAAMRVVAAGRGVIYLVPEIALTHQVVDQFSDVFGDQVAVIHSALTPSQRLQQWSRIRSGAARVVIGARSAVFAPLRDLGLMVIDEEHETSYKAGATPRFHARQVAMHRCSAEGATLVMGSATPSLEALHHMRRGVLRRLDLTRRPGGARMPSVEVVEMKGQPGPLSERLLAEIRAAAAAGRQSILFLNRRGFAYFFHCRSCGFEMRCVRCSVSLTFHKASRVMLCHYCGYRAAPLRVCPECASLDIGYGGYGTQRVEEELAAAVPGAARTAPRHRRAARPRRAARRAQPVPQRRGGRAGRHPDGRQGAQFPGGPAGRHHQRRHRVAPARLSRRRTHLQPDRAGRRPRRPRAAGRPPCWYRPTMPTGTRSGWRWRVAPRSSTGAKSRCAERPDSRRSRASSGWCSVRAASSAPTPRPPGSPTTWSILAARQRRGSCSVRWSARSSGLPAATAFICCCATPPSARCTGG